MTGMAIVVWSPVLMGHSVEAVSVSGFKSLWASISVRSSASRVASNTGFSLGLSLTYDSVQKGGSESRNSIVGNTVVVRRGSEGVAGVGGSYGVPCVGVWAPCVGVGKPSEGVWKPCVGVCTEFVRTETVITGNGHHFPPIVNVGVGI